MRLNVILDSCYLMDSHSKLHVNIVFINNHVEISESVLNGTLVKQRSVDTISLIMLL